MNNSERVKKWRKDTKNRIVESMGGKCVCCGYSKCHDALDLHHLDPDEKEIGLAGIRANPKKWTTIVKELRKCVLVCNRCHKEIHAGITEVPKDVTRFDENFIEYKVIEKSHCPMCGKEKKRWNKTCSSSCAAKMKGKVDWDSVNLQELLLKHSFVEIGNMLDVSDVAVRKRAKKLNI